MLMNGKMTNEKPSTKKFKNKDRLITRLILTLGLAGTIACVGASVYTYGNICDASNKYTELDKQKNAYLDSFEPSPAFQDTYNAQLASLNERLISGMISDSEYNNEIKNLNSNSYTEQVLLDKADNKTKGEFNEINETYLQL